MTPTNALDTLRDEHLGLKSAAGLPRPDNCEVCAALARVEAVIEAAEDVAFNEYDEIGPYVYVHIQEIRALRKALAALDGEA